VANVSRKKVTRITVAALAAVACALSACTAGESGEDAALSTMPTTSETETSTESDTESATTSEDETTTTPTSSSSDDESSDDLNRYDGYFIHDFYTALHQLPDLEVKSGESDPDEYRVKAELLNDEESLRVISYIYVPSVNGKREAITSPSDEGFKQAKSSAVKVFTDEGDTYDETEYETDNFKWQCIEGTNTQGGNIDYSICITHFAGRLVEAHRLILSEDRDDSDKDLDKLLQDFDDAISNMEKRG